MNFFKIEIATQARNLRADLNVIANKLAELADLADDVADARDDGDSLTAAAQDANRAKDRLNRFVAIVREDPDKPEDAPADTEALPCPWCGIADVAIESMQCADRIVTGVDEDNGPVYWAECQRCGAQRADCWVGG